MVDFFKNNLVIDQIVPIEFFVHAFFINGSNPRMEELQ